MRSSKVKTHYQHRVTKLVWLSNIYCAAGAAWLIYKQIDQTGWLVYFSTVAILYGIAAASDAVYDSLYERTNLQSAWLQSRLNALESSSGLSTSGDAAWAANAVPTSDPTHYYDLLPERVSEQR